MKKKLKFNKTRVDFYTWTEGQFKYWSSVNQDTEEILAVSWCNYQGQDSERIKNSRAYSAVIKTTAAVLGMGDHRKGLKLLQKYKHINGKPKNMLK